MTLLFGGYRVQPGELDEMTIGDLRFWVGRAEEWAKWQRKSSR